MDIGAKLTVVLSWISILFKFNFQHPVTKMGRVSTMLQSTTQWRNIFKYFWHVFFSRGFFHNDWGAGGRGTLRGITVSEKWVTKCVSFVFSIREIKKKINKIKSRECNVMLKTLSPELSQFDDLMPTKLFSEHKGLILDCKVVLVTSELPNLKVIKIIIVVY